MGHGGQGREGMTAGVLGAGPVGTAFLDGEQAQSNQQFARDWQGVRGWQQQQRQQQQRQQQQHTVHPILPVSQLGHRVVLGEKRTHGTWAQHEHGPGEEEEVVVVVVKEVEEGDKEEKKELQRSAGNMVCI